MILLVSAVCILALYWFVLLAIVMNYVVRLTVLPLILKIMKQ